MRKDLWKLLIVILLLINTITIWTYLLRKYYIIYYNLQIYNLISLVTFVLVVMGIIVHKRDIKGTGILLAGVMGISLLLAVPLSFYPYVVNNPDVIKMLQLTSLLLNREFELARHIDYSAFPGFSYIVGTISVIIGMPLRVKLASLVYILSSFVFLLTVIALGKYSNWIGMYLLVLFSSGFIYSFDYLSPQLFGQILLITSLIMILNNKLTNNTRFVIIFLSYCGAILTHPESTLMLLVAFSLYFGITTFTTGKSVSITLMGTVLLLITLIAYATFFVSSSGPGYILKTAMAFLLNINEIILYLFTRGSKSVVTSASIKPQSIIVLSQANILYNASLLLLAIYVFWKHRREFLGYGILMFSFIISAGIFLFIFGFSSGQFVGRSAFGVSLILAILVARYIIKRQDKITILFTIFSVLILLFATFPARVAPQEWNVHAENYYPPVYFIVNHYTREYKTIYYFLYPNVGVSIREANYVILPTGQKVYVSGMGRYLGWDAEKIIRRLTVQNSIVYSNGLSSIIISELK
ncbi:hypothetical protein [Thermococcus radiotolerans]|uniref:Uncharacterized protein n=1 Tax=Thermococcus radiotolerans TaxID=187880 RepID=A0A2Z2N467_9EURY|nr:hypothetical protein [Thermococcus radiotolerans]ASJ15373.1 hypothetical protein A3L10_09615 [Thermococcus radiotolerans]